MPSADPWCFVLDTGEAIDVRMRRAGDDRTGYWWSSTPMPSPAIGPGRETERGAAYALAAAFDGRVVEVLAPGQVSRAELAAEVARLHAIEAAAREYIAADEATEALDKGIAHIDASWRRYEVARRALRALLTGGPDAVR